MLDQLVCSKIVPDVNRQPAGTPLATPRNALMYIGYFVRGGAQIGADRDPTPDEFHQAYQSLVADYLGSQLGAD